MIHRTGFWSTAIVLSLVAARISANDTYFYMAGGSLYPTAEGVTSVRMDSEVIRLDLFDNYYLTDVTFQFSNPGRATSAAVGFPIKTEGSHGYATISEFQSWTNGVPDNPELVPIQVDWQLETGITSAWTRTVDFPSSERVATRVSYRSTYGRSAPSDSVVTYLYGTGSVWDGPIGSVDLIVTNHTERWIYAILLGNDGTEPSGESVQFQDDLSSRNEGEASADSEPVDHVAFEGEER